MRRLARALSALVVAASQAAVAADCPADHDKLEKALKASVKPSGGPTNGGLDNNEWAALVTRDGAVCAVAFSGGKPDDQWLGSRAIAAEKANTANALSLNGFALSTANLYAGSQPGGSLFGLALSAPPNPAVLYSGDPTKFGSASDPFVGKSLGGVITFGGGLALYDGRERRRRSWRQRRHILRRSQHRLACAPGAGLGQGPRGRGPGPQR